MDWIAPLFSQVNFLFTGVLLFGVVMLATQVLGMGHGDSEVSHDADVAHDVDVDHQVDVSHELAHEVEHDVAVDHADHEMSHDSEHSHDAEGRDEFSLLAFIGLGLGPPSSLVFMTLFLSFGLIGLGLNRVVTPFIETWWIVLPLNAVLAFIGSSLLLHLLIPQMAKLAPGKPQTAYSLVEGLGKVGECTMRIDHRGGEARVKIRDSVVTIDCELADGEVTISSGEQVVTLGFDRDRRKFTVRRFENVIRPTTH